MGASLPLPQPAARLGRQLGAGRAGGDDAGGGRRGGRRGAWPGTGTERSRSATKPRARGWRRRSARCRDGKRRGTSTCSSAKEGGQGGRTDPGDAAGGCEGLRRELIRGEFPADTDDLEETADQLLEMGRRTGEAAATAGSSRLPTNPPPPAACSPAGRSDRSRTSAPWPRRAGRGSRRRSIHAAIAASREAGHRHTFIVADADDWPRLLYAKLGFEVCGVLHVLRKAPTAGITGGWQRLYAGTKAPRAPSG